MRNDKKIWLGLSNTENKFQTALKIILLKVSDTITFNVNQKDRIANRFIIYAILRNVGKLLPRKESLDPSSSKYGCNTDRSATKQTKINPIFPPQKFPQNIVRNILKSMLAQIWVAF